MCGGMSAPTPPRAHPPPRARARSTVPAMSAVEGRQDVAVSGPAQAAGAPREGVDRAVLEALVERLRAICGREHVHTHEHQLRTYESDGLLQYKVRPGA